MHCHPIQLTDNPKKPNCKRQHDITKLREKVMLAEYERLCGDKILSIADAKERLLRRLK